MEVEMTTQAVWCCGCGEEVTARLTDGREVYPHRRDLAGLPFWKCDGCGNHVGCHHKTADRTRPLGIIPTPELRNARSHIHRILDPIWQGKRIARGKIYAILSDKIGRQYHTGEIRTLDEARTVYRAVQEVARSITT